jgi:micrococcal nuclease
MQLKITFIEMAAAAAIGIILPLSFGAGLTSSPSQVLASVAKPDVALVAIPHTRSIKPRIPIEVLRVIDGDTVEVRAQIWLDQHVTTKVRIRSIDAPELQSRCAQERLLAQASRDQLLSLFTEKRGYLTDLGYDKFGSRVVASIATLEGRDIASEMVSLGHARPYSGGRRQVWC